MHEMLIQNELYTFSVDSNKFRCVMLEMLILSDLHMFSFHSSQLM